MKPLAIDLYCGLGGWTEGLLAEGYDVIGFDIERHDYGTGGYPAQLVLQSVLTLHGSQFKDAALIVASPPCQEFSYMAMPWSLAKKKRAQLLEDAEGRKRLTALFDACFRIQREACVAAGRHIPLVVENVRGANEWVGRSRWNYGSFHLWGDVPALMPQTKAVKLGGGASWHPPADPRHIPGLDFTRLAGQKVPGFRFDGSGKSFQTASVLGLKTPPGNCSEPMWKDRPISRLAHPTEEEFKRHGFKNIPHKPSGHWTNPAENGVKGFVPNGERLGKNVLARHGSKSKARKAASAAIAKIPYPLSSHIARYWMPEHG